MTTHHTDVFVGGRWIPAHSTGRIEVVNPATEEAWASVPDSDSIDVDRAVSAARAALPRWAGLPAYARAALLERFAAEIERRAPELARTITTENGTPVAESVCAPAHGAAHVRLTAALAEHLDREDVRPNPMARGRSVVRRRPVGVAGLITPWNFPLGLILIKLAPALLAGCTVVIKPAPETPMAARLLMDAVAAAGLPNGTVNLITGGAATGQALIEHSGVSKISFTGSTEAGRRIGEVCGRLLRPVTLELGGKSPALVLDDADPNVLTANILKVSMRNTGQTCKACTRLLIPESRAQELTDLIADVVRSAPMGDPHDPATFFGPLVSARHLKRVLGYLHVGHAEGAKAVTGGGRSDRFDRGYYVEPTVFTDVTPDMRIAREEIFGPVLSVLTYRNLEHAVALANDSAYGLAATVFSQDLDRAAEVAARLEAGNVGINHYGSNAAAPFGGLKDSGLGTEFGPEGLEEYVVYTSVHHLD